MQDEVKKERRLLQSCLALLFIAVMPFAIWISFALLLAAAFPNFRR